MTWSFGSEIFQARLSSVQGVLRLLAKTLIFLVIIVVIAKLSFFRIEKISKSNYALSSSLAPTLWAGDTILVSSWGEAKVGSLMLCDHPTVPTSKIIGRVAARAGQEIDVHSTGRVIINGRDLVQVGEFKARELASIGGGQLAADADADANSLFVPQCPVDEFTVPSPKGRQIKAQHCQLEWMGGFHLFAPAPSGSYVSRKRVKVQPGMLFLVSDNRLYPFDSRSFGPVPAISCKEHVVMRLFGAEGYFGSARRLEFVY